MIEDHEALIPDRPNPTSRRFAGLVLLNLSGLLILAGGLYDLLFPDLPMHVLDYLRTTRDALDDRIARFLLAIFDALGGALTAIGLAVLLLVNGPVRRGSRGALPVVLVLVCVGEGPNAWGMFTVEAPWWAPLTFIALAVAGAALLTGRRTSPAHRRG